MRRKWAKPVGRSETSEVASRFVRFPLCPTEAKRLRSRKTPAMATKCFLFILLSIASLQVRLFAVSSRWDKLSALEDEQRSASGEEADPE